MREVLIGLAVAACALSTTAALSGSREPLQSGSAVGVEHQVVATAKTSTMEKELNQAAEKGFRF